MKNLIKPFLVVLGTALLLALAPASLRAQASLDPATLFIGNPATCPTGTCGTFAFNGETIAISTNTANLFENGVPKGADTFQTLFLLLGVPNGGSAPNITSPGSISPISEGTFTSGDAYDNLGLPGNGSQNLVSNWMVWDANVVGLTATSFTLFEYVLPGNTLANANPTTFTFGGAGLPVGSFLFAWGCVDTNAPADCLQKDTFSTPFTEDGIVTPEPASMLLMGTGLVGLGGLLRRRKKGNA